MELEATAAVFEALAVGLAATVTAELTGAVALELKALTAAFEALAAGLELLAAAATLVTLAAAAAFVLTATIEVRGCEAFDDVRSPSGPWTLSKKYKIITPNFS